MLKTVRMLRRRLRNVFFRTNRVSVIGLLQRKPRTGTSRRGCLDDTRIDDQPCHLQPYRNDFSEPFPSTPLARTLSILSPRAPNHKWRSSLDVDDKCHLPTHLKITTSVSEESYDIALRLGPCRTAITRLYPRLRTDHTRQGQMPRLTAGKRSTVPYDVQGG